MEGTAMVDYIVKKIKDAKDKQGLAAAQAIYRQLFILKDRYEDIREFVELDLITAGYGDCIVTE